MKQLNLPLSSLSSFSSFEWPDRLEGFGGEKKRFIISHTKRKIPMKLILSAFRLLFQDGPDVHNIDNVADADGADGAHVRVLLDGSTGRRL